MCQPRDVRTGRTYVYQYKQRNQFIRTVRAQTSCCCRSSHSHLSPAAGGEKKRINRSSKGKKRTTNSYSLVIVRMALKPLTGLHCPLRVLHCAYESLSYSVILVRERQKFALAMPCSTLYCQSFVMCFPARSLSLNFRPLAIRD